MTRGRGGARLPLARLWTLVPRLRPSHLQPHPVAPTPALLEPAARDPRSAADAPPHACRWRRRDRYQVACADRAPPFLPRTGTLARSNAAGTTPTAPVLGDTI